MNTLRPELRPDWATTERLYPLVLQRLQEYETLWDAQSEDTPEAVFDAEYQKMESYLSQLTGKDLSGYWLWEWWEADGIEAFAFDLALPPPTKVAHISKDELRAMVDVIVHGMDIDWAHYDFEANVLEFLKLSAQASWYQKSLALNFPKRYKAQYFNCYQDKDGNWYEPSVDDIVAKMGW